MKKSSNTKAKAKAKAKPTKTVKTTPELHNKHIAKAHKCPYAMPKIREGNDKTAVKGAVDSLRGVVKIPKITKKEDNVGSM